MITTNTHKKVANTATWVFNNKAVFSPCVKLSSDHSDCEQIVDKDRLDKFCQTQNILIKILNKLVLRNELKGNILVLFKLTINKKIGFSPQLEASDFNNNNLITTCTRT